MPDYEKMYFELFNRVSDAIEILQKAQQDAENAYVEQTDAPVVPFEWKKSKEG